MYINSISLYVTKELQLGSEWAGYLMGLAAFFEIPFMVLAGIYGPRIGNKKMMLIALIFGGLFFGGLLVADNIFQLMMLQLLNGVFVAVTACLGMLLIQDLMKKEMGLATTLFSSAQQISMLVGSLSVGIIAQFFSFYAVYIACVLMLIISFALLFAVKEATTTGEYDDMTDDTQLAS